MFNAKTVLSFGLLTLSLLDSVTSVPVRREVPQEHSHNAIIASVRTSLNTNNPAKIEDSVFGLLGDKAALEGAGSITDPECLQQATADQAFTNAKAAGDVEGMTNALIYRALERNTGSVGLQSNSCTTIQAVNPEIAAIKQHQDPASTNAAATNKAIALELAKQIASIGGNPQDALKSGTFAPGKIGDPTAKGNTCDVADDTEGCIFSQNLIVDDATAAEIDAAVQGISASTSSGSANASSSSSSTASASSDSAASSASSSDSNSASCSASSESSAAPAAAATGTSDAASSSSGSAASSSGIINTGPKCTDPGVKFGAGLGGRQATAFAFEADDPANSQAGSALNIGVILNAICTGLVNHCGFKNTDAVVTQCQQAETETKAQGNNGATADFWNAKFGIKTNFAALDTQAAAAKAGK